MDLCIYYECISVQLICAFIFVHVYAKSRFSHDTAQIWKVDIGLKFIFITYYEKKNCFHICEKQRHRSAAVPGLLISVFVVSLICTDSYSECSSFHLPPVATQPRLSHT